MILDIETLTINGEDVGIIIPHDKPDGSPCGVTAYWKWAKDCQIWTITSKHGQGLTLTPSIICQNCGLHGFVTNGEFVA